MILAIGNSGTYEVEGFKAVFEALRKRGHKSVLFKQDKCLESDHLVFELIAGKPKYFVVIDGKKYDVDSFSAIWYMHPHLPKELLTYEPAEHRQLINRQFDEMRRALWSVFRHKKWINDPWAVIMAENKIYQSYAAIQAGLRIHDTIVTSHPEEVRNFYESHERNIVVKLFATSPILDHVIFTNRIKPEDMAKIDSVRYSPSIFQAYVPKAYELRITVVGEKFFSAKVLSQSDEETAIDWRKKPLLNDFQVKMEQTNLPQEIEKKILLLMQNLGLRYGCVDMIVTPTDEYVFLEINPNGQWYFVQLRTEMEIAEALADLLT